MSAHDNGPRFIINIEGAEHPWDSSTITLAELRQLAGWESTQQVVEVDLQSMTETTVAEDAIIELKPGHGFAKKIRFQRG
jgi:hypothetical protein